MRKTDEDILKLMIHQLKGEWYKDLINFENHCTLVFIIV